MKIRFRIIVLFASAILLLCGQSFSQDAKGHYAQASLAFDAGNYKAALFYLGEAEKLLGKSNPKIQSLKALCFYEQGDEEAALVEVTKYFRTVSPGKKDTDEYKEMEALQRDLTETVRKAYDLKRASVESEEQEELRRLSSLQNSEIEAVEYELVKESGSTTAMKAFIKKYPASTRNAEFEKRIAEINKGLDYDYFVIRGDEAMKAGRWETARSNYKKANEIRWDSRIEAKIEECNELHYEELVAEGDLMYINRDWDNAIKKYTAAIAIKNKFDARFKLGNAKDYSAFAKALKSDQISGYIQYLQRFNSPLFKKTAEDIIIGKLLTRAESEFSAGKYFEVENSLAEAFEYRTSGIWPHYEARYFAIMLKQAEKLTKGAKSQRIEGNTQAIRLYEKLNAEFNPKYRATISKLKRKEVRWNRPDYRYMGWHADADNLWGMMWGKLNNRKLGTYFQIRTNLNLFQQAADWETDNTNSLEESIDKNKTYNNVDLNRNLFVSFGLTKKVVHPFWIYGGVGMAYYSQLKEFVNRNTAEVEYVRNRDEKYFAVNPELGIQIKLAALSFQYGVNKPLTPAFTKQVVHHFGVGVQL